MFDVKISRARLILFDVTLSAGQSANQAQGRQGGYHQFESHDE